MLDIYREEGCIREYPTRFKKKTGELRDVVISSEVIQFTGETSLLSFFLDITEQRRAEAALKKRLEEKEVLLHEIHHRVKNNLTIISSLLNLQSSSITSPARAITAFLESRDRVMSMALIYEKLYESDDFTAVDLGDYILDLTSRLRLSHRPDGNIHIEVDTTEVYLDVNSAVSIGLIINELVTNTLIHAFPDKSAGIITVSLTEADGYNYSLTVSDNGIGLPADYEQRKGVGLTMVGLLTEQLEGHLTVEPFDGTCFNLLFPRTIQYTGVMQNTNSV
jgi:two-component sensor histidine kinase